MLAYYFSPLKWLAILLCCIPISFAQHVDGTDNPERVIWRKTPIAIPLVVGDERLVHFPNSVSIGLPQSLTKLLRSQSINGTLYLLAHEPFDSTRVLVRSETGGSIYVLDISAEPNDSETATLPDIQVETPNVVDAATATNEGNQTMPWGYVALTRYAAQQLYAPTRLIPGQPGVVAMPVNDEQFNLVHGAAVEAVPVAAWKAGLSYVTAVRLTNLTQQAVFLDPRELRGAWRAATFQHNRLLPSGDEADTTTVYLVSDRPFDVAL